ncbi:MAG: L,D-transpeptidase [Chloroflexi bacterium]|nr:L,D-transpeptidase [Chloroflexota bacterium]
MSRAVVISFGVAAVVSAVNPVIAAHQRPAAAHGAMYNQKPHAASRHQASHRQPLKVSHSIWIDKTHQRLYAFSGHRLVLAAECSTASGKKEWAPGDQRVEISQTPSGSFHILNKDSDHYSKAYQVHMLYALFFSPGRAIHGTYPSVYHELGSAASGGCVRLTRGRAAILYSWARVGDPVYIAHSLPQGIAALVHRSPERATLIHQVKAGR